MKKKWFIFFYLCLLFSCRGLAKHPFARSSSYTDSWDYKLYQLAKEAFKISYTTIYSSMHHFLKHKSWLTNYARLVKYAAQINKKIKLWNFYYIRINTSGKNGIIINFDVAKPFVGAIHIYFNKYKLDKAKINKYPDKTLKLYVSIASYGEKIEQVSDTTFQEMEKCDEIQTIFDTTCQKTYTYFVNIILYFPSQAPIYKYSNKRIFTYQTGYLK